MQNMILQLLENPFISCPFCLQKGLSAHTCVGQKGRDQFTPVCFGPCYKSWFQMSENFLLFQLKHGTLMSSENVGKPIKKMGSPPGIKSPEVPYEGVTGATAWDTKHCPGCSDSSMTEKAGV